MSLYMGRLWLVGYISKIIILLPDMTSTQIIIIQLTRFTLFLLLIYWYISLLLLILLIILMFGDAEFSDDIEEYETHDDG